MLLENTFIRTTKKAGHLCRGCNIGIMGSWYLRMAEYELLHPTGASATTLLTIAVSQSDPSGTVRTCASKNAARSKTKYPTTGSWSLIPTLPYWADFGQECWWAAFVRNLPWLWATMVGRNLLWARAWGAEQLLSPYLVVFKWVNIFHFFFYTQ